MPKRYSLKRRRDFQKLLKLGIWKSSKNFSIVFVDSDETKFAIMVDSKTIPLASHRVYTKRVIREIVRRHFLDKVQRPMFIGIKALKDLRGTDFAQNREELIGLLSQIDFNRRAARRT